MIFLLVLIVVGAILYHVRPKTWWVYLLGMLVATVVGSCFNVGS